MEKLVFVKNLSNFKDLITMMVFILLKMAKMNIINGRTDIRIYCLMIIPE